MPTPIALSDDELTAIMNAARPLAPRDPLIPVPGKSGGLGSAQPLRGPSRVWHA